MALQMVRAFNMKCKSLTLFPLAWHISPLQLTPWCSFPLFFYSLALFAANASAVCGIWDHWERCRNTSPKCWAVAVATLSSSDHNFQYFKKFPDTLQAWGKQCSGEKRMILRSGGNQNGLLWATGPWPIKKMIMISSWQGKAASKQLCRGTGNGPWARQFENPCFYHLF